MNVRYRVELSQAERDELTAMLGGGKHAAHQIDVHNRQSPRQTPPRLSSHRQRVKITVMNH